MSEELLEFLNGCNPTMDAELFREKFIEVETRLIKDKANFDNLRLSQLRNRVKATGVLSKEEVSEITAKLFEYHYIYNKE